MIREESNCDDKSGQKVFKWSELHLSEMTSSKIHTLVGDSKFKSTIFTGMEEHGWRQKVIFQTRETDFWHNGALILPWILPEMCSFEFLNVKIGKV